MDILNLINSGQFGSTSPIQPTGYNPYNNAYQPNPYGAYANYQQPVMINQYPDTIQTGYYQPNYNYYNNYRNPYYQNFNTYGYPQTYYSQYNIQKQRSEEFELFKIKRKMLDKYFNVDTDYEELEKQYFKQFEPEPIEKVIERNEYQFMQRVSQIASQPRAYDSVIHEAECIRQMSINNAKEFEGHSLFQFFKDDMPQIYREIWCKENIDRSRSLASTYNSNAYNELLNMHQSNNPYTSMLLDNSRYDNNIDDIEMGLNIAMDKARRRKAILEGKVPAFISSPEIQEKRNQFLNTVFENMYKRDGVKANE